MIATNELIGICLTIVSNFANTLQVPKAEVPETAADVVSYVIGTPNSPLDVHVTSRSGACFGMEDGMIYYYYSPRSLFHEQDPRQFPKYYGPSLYDTNTVVLVASNVLRRLIKTGNPSMAVGVPRVQKAEGPFAFYQVQWPKITAHSHVMAADMEIDGRSGSVVSLILFDDVFRDPALAERIKKQVFRADGQPLPERQAARTRREFEPEQDEPMYEGQPLSEWLDNYAQHVWSGHEPAETNPGFIAVRRLGTNALPTLLRWAANIETDAQANKHSQFVGAGFDILRSEALPALPELKRMLHESPSDQSVGMSINALAHIGLEALPVLRDALNSRLRVGRGGIATVLGDMRYLGTNMSQCIPALAQCALDGDSRVASAAARSLGKLSLVPQVSIPALTNCYGHSSFGPVRLEAIEALEKFGIAGRAALPTLIRASDDPDPEVRIEAQGFLQEISPETVTNLTRRP